jgi:hypothetical protein
MRPSYLQPALIGGAVLGVLSALPILSVANCCCIWLIAGGVTGAYLLQQNTIAPITLGDGAIVGALAGVFGSFVRLLIGIPFRAMAAPMQGPMFARAIERADLPPEVRHNVEAFLAGGGGIAVLFVVFFFNLALALVFSTLGGMVGAMLFRKAAPPPDAPPFVPPPPMGPPPVGPSSGPPPLPPTI